MRRKFFHYGCIIAALCGSYASAEVTHVEQWPAKGKIIGKDNKKSEDISGIACSTPSGFPRTCLVIDDNLQSAQMVTLEDGKLKAGDMIPLISNDLHGDALELDGEGVAFDKGAFYVIGSHGHPRDKKHKLDPVSDKERITARIAAASQIVKIVLNGNGSLAVQQPPLSLAKAIAEQPDLIAFAGKRLDENGLTIEGIAIKGDWLYAGFRGPSLPGGHAAILRVSLEGLISGGALDARLFKLPLGEGVGIRDLAPSGDSSSDHILVLAGPSADASGKYTILDWDGATDSGFTQIADLTNVQGAGDDHKAEALLPLSVDGSGRKFLILFDGEKEGAPIAITVN